MSAWRFGKINEQIRGTGIFASTTPPDGNVSPSSPLIVDVIVKRGWWPNNRTRAHLRESRPCKQHGSYDFGIVSVYRFVGSISLSLLVPCARVFTRQQQRRSRRQPIIIFIARDKLGRSPSAVARAWRSMTMVGKGKGKIRTRVSRPLV